jgi:ABC-2 type transport system ATP-binding protein
MNPAIETHNLSKSYGNVHAVEGVSLRVERGEIYGFLGLNGAGKTTTIRALLGMIKPGAGWVKLLDEPIGPNGHGPWRQVGHLVERPTAYPELSVRENLEIARRLQGVSDRKATDRAIDRLGLNAYANRKAGGLSTGNRQRLGLARALLHEPELLILDEPANGLDPAGVVEIRKLLEHLTRERGTTVFMSSHILTEVDRLATRIGIIHQGRLLEELEHDKLQELRARRLEVQTRDLQSAEETLTRAGYAVKTEEGTLYLSEERALEEPDTVATILVEAGLPPTRLVVTQENLEEYFLRLTGGTA